MTPVAPLPPAVGAQPPPSHTHTPASITAPKGSESQKSWRRKYRKLHAQFDAAMSRSDTLFSHDTKLTTLLSRLNEQNTDLMELIESTTTARPVVLLQGEGESDFSDSDEHHPDPALEKEVEELLVLPEELVLPSDERNPMDHYNWLRRNEPQVFLQDLEVQGKGGKRRKRGEEEEEEPVGRGKKEKEGGKRKRAETTGEKKKGGKRRKKGEE